MLSNMNIKSKEEHPKSMQIPECAEEYLALLYDILKRILSGTERMFDVRKQKLPNLNRLKRQHPSEHIIIHEMFGTKIQPRCKHIKDSTG